MPTIPEAMAAATAAHQAGQLARAEQIYRAILQADPDLPAALNMLGVAIFQQGRAAEALPWLERSVRLAPADSACWSNLGPVCWELGDRQRAVECFQEAVRLDPAHAEAHLNLAQAHLGLGCAMVEQLRWEEAAHCFRRSLEINPRQPEVHRELGGTLQSLGRFDEAEPCFRRAAELRPDWAEARAGLANLLQAAGRLDEALAEYGRALALDPGAPTIHSRYLMCLQYSPDVTPEQLRREHAAWDTRHAAPLRGRWPVHQPDRDPDRPLRLGFVSYEFGFHTVGILLVRTLEGLREQPCRIVCYSDRGAADHLTGRFMAAAHEWRQSGAMSDEELAAQIRADRIDVLVDLAGHTARNRLLVFARKPAPIQATWLGYVGTTGLAAMDYLVADPRQVPPEADSHYAERVLRLPDDYATFEPFPKSPPVGPLPALATGRVTFGSLNNPSKFNPQVIALWARILRQVPDSRLLVRYRGLAGGTAERFRRMLAGEGVAADRVELLGAASTMEILAEYNRIDVALDPFPYSGGLTTLEALWMGVPVITLPGRTFAGRHSLSHLTAVGLSETIARDEDHYVELAAQWAGDLPRLAALRAGLRDQVARSPVCDGRQAAANLMKLLRQAWRQWLVGQVS